MKEVEEHWGKERKQKEEPALHASSSSIKCPACAVKAGILNRRFKMVAIRQASGSPTEGGDHSHLLIQQPMPLALVQGMYGRVTGTAGTNCKATLVYAASKNLSLERILP